MSTPDKGTVTRLLNKAAQGDAPARDELYRLVQHELLSLAKGRLRREPKLKGKDPQSLVQDAYLKLNGGSPPEWLDRKQFYGYAHRAMWQICVDEIRRNKHRLHDHPLSDWMAEFRQDPLDMVALDDALAKLAEVRPRVASVVQMRFVESRSVKETAELLGVADRTVESDWEFGRAFLHRELKSGDEATRAGRAS